MGKEKTLGFKGEDVYDESYRKAGKLDWTSFRPMLNISSLGLVSIVRDGLLHGMEAQKPIRAELYNLNVYGVVLHLKHVAHVLMRSRRRRIILQGTQGYSPRSKDVRISSHILPNFPPRR